MKGWLGDQDMGAHQFRFFPLVYFFRCSKDVGGHAYAVNMNYIEKLDLAGELSALFCFLTHLCSFDRLRRPSHQPPL